MKAVPLGAWIAATRRGNDGHAAYALRDDGIVFIYRSPFQEIPGQPQKFFQPVMVHPVACAFDVFDAGIFEKCGAAVFQRIGGPAFGAAKQ